MTTGTSLHETTAEPPIPAPPVPSEARRRLTWVIQLFGGATAAIFWALFCNGVIDFAQTGGSFQRIFTYELGVMRTIFMLSALVVLGVLGVLVAITNRFVLSCGVLLALSTVIGIADRQKLRLRREPLYPSDFDFLSQIGFLREMVSPVVLFGGLGLAVTLVLGAYLLGRRLGRRFPHPRRADGRPWWTWQAGRFVIGLVSVLFLTSLHGFNDSGGLYKRAYVAAGAQWAFWSQTVNYARHGFIAGFLYNMPVPAMEQPPDYSRARMHQIAARYAVDPRTPATADFNTVVVLSEAF